MVAVASAAAAVLADVQCSSYDTNCSACLVTNDTRAAWASPCIWTSAFVCDPPGSQACHRCCPLLWWTEYKQQHPNVNTTTDCGRFPPTPPPPKPLPSPPPAPPPPPCTDPAARGARRAACWVGRWSGPIGGLPTSQLSNVPALGNGYVGVQLASGVAAASSDIELWINTNANWGCDDNKANPKLTVAVCSLVGLGGLSFSVPALGPNSTIAAEQRLAPATVHTRHSSSAGTLETLSYLHPTTNVLVTNLTWTGTAAAELGIAVWVPAVCVPGGCRRSAANHSVLGTGGQQLLTAWRDASTDGGARDPTIRRMRTALAVVLPATAAPAGRGGGGYGGRASARSTVRLQPGEVLSIVTSVADNLLGGNAHDPVPDAVDLAGTGGATVSAAVAAASQKWWQSFWAKSSIHLPGSPLVEAFWDHLRHLIMATVFLEQLELTLIYHIYTCSAIVCEGSRDICLPEQVWLPVRGGRDDGVGRGAGEDRGSAATARAVRAVGVVGRPFLERRLYT